MQTFDELSLINDGAQTQLLFTTTSFGGQTQESFLAGTNDVRQTQVPLIFSSNSGQTHKPVVLSL